MKATMELCVHERVYVRCILIKQTKRGIDIGFPKKKLYMGCGMLDEFEFIRISSITLIGALHFIRTDILQGIEIISIK